MTAAPTGRQVACATLTHLEPAGSLLGGLLQAAGPEQVLAGIRTGTLPASAADDLGPAPVGDLRRALAHWRAQLATISPDGGLTAYQRAGIRLICPGEPEWPTQLDDLGAARLRPVGPRRR